MLNKKEKTELVDKFYKDNENIKLLLAELREICKFYSVLYTGVTATSYAFLCSDLLSVEDKKLVYSILCRYKKYQGRAEIFSRLLEL